MGGVTQLTLLFPCSPNVALRALKTIHRDFRSHVGVMLIDLRKGGHAMLHICPSAERVQRYRFSRTLNLRFAFF